MVAFAKCIFCERTANPLIFVNLALILPKKFFMDLVIFAVLDSFRFPMKPYLILDVSIGFVAVCFVKYIQLKISTSMTVIGTKWNNGLITSVKDQSVPGD